MLECLMIGDSIAVGLQAYQPACEVHAKVGANSDYIVKNYKKPGQSDYTVISMGSNWPDNPRNYRNAVELRKSLKGSELVIWILPYNRKAANVIRQVAEQFQDNYIDLQPYGTNDRVHPKSYSSISKEVQQQVEYFYN